MWTKWADYGDLRAVISLPLSRCIPLTLPRERRTQGRVTIGYGYYYYYYDYFSRRSKG